MAFDIIVFSQQELNNALENGITSIALCDNSFVIPPVGDVAYTAIGQVIAVADGKEKDFRKHNVVFDGFVPKFKAEIIPPPLTLINPPSVSSYTTSYMLSSYFMTSYRYEYEYEYEAGSFTSSYRTSYQTSYSSFTSSFRTKFSEGCIMVNGYGLNLI